MTPEEIPEWNPAPLPGAWALLRSALCDHIREDAREFPNFVRTIMARFKSAKAHREATDVPVFDPMTDKLDPSPFNGAFSPRRRFATCTLPLDRVRGLKKALGGAVNDGVRSLVAGALRTYLQDDG